LIGSFVSEAYELDRGEENGKFLKAFRKWAGVKPLVEISGGRAEGRILEGAGYKLLFGFNHGSEKANISFRLRVPKRKYRVLDLFRQAEENWSYEDGLKIERELESQEVCVLKIEQV